MASRLGHSEPIFPQTWAMLLAITFYCSSLPGCPAVSSSGETAVGSQERGRAHLGRCHNAQVHTRLRPEAGSRKKQVDGTRLSDFLLDEVSADQLECVYQ